MKFAFQFPMRAMKRWDDWIAGHSLGELAVAAEDVGFDLVSSTDHPFPDEAWLASGGHHAFDPFVSLAFMAAQTSRIRALTMLVVSGYRHPYITAKAAGTLDNLSGGRLVLGMGAGYQQAEFDVVGASFADRGPRFDSALAVMREHRERRTHEYGLRRPERSGGRSCARPGPVTSSTSTTLITRPTAT